ncbi:MAG: PDZ domain-containing protein [Capsulimonadales bacterium]|nr:PDZ domain-containing protein [Capsulimonadales bacterium]
MLRRSLPCLVFLASVLLSILGTVRPVFAVPEVAFTVSMPQPWTHYLDVEMRVSGLTGKTADLVMPVWTPGSYLIREHARNVQEVRVSDSGDRSLPVRKVSKNIWRIEKGAATAFTARYRVYANQSTVQTAEVNDVHAFWNNGAVLMHLGGGLAHPATLAIRPPENWRIATALDAVPGVENTFRAPNFDILYDSPVEVGTFKELAFTAMEKPHRIIITGRGNYDPERMTADVKKIVETAGSLMGGLPYDRYTFFLTLRPQGGGGLEHLTSTALIFPSFGFRTNYLAFLSLVSHEFFHAWNVKRIRPDALGPFDYSGENYTRNLWIAEGITSYYEWLLLQRAGLIPADRFLKEMADGIASVEQTPGRKIRSLEEASFDAWIKYYRPDENSVNSQVSYYTKGAVIGMLLDLTLRAATGGAKSLDDVLRTLFNDPVLRKRNYTPIDFQRACETVAGRSLETFFADYVRGTRDPDYETVLAAVGLNLRRESDRPATNSLGARFADDPLGVRVVSVPSDSPAYVQGISADDLLIAIDGLRITGSAFLAERIREAGPGATLTLTLFRQERLKTLEIKPEMRKTPEFALTPSDKSTVEQTRLRNAWLGIGSNAP